MFLLQQKGDGYFSGTVEDVVAGDRYLYLLDDGATYPDPASRFQPDGVHGASQVVDPCLFPWDDGGWTGIPLEEYVMYELHVGTFTSAGTFEAVIPLLDYLKELGVTAVELMPVAQFPGNRNWGYDGVYPFAPQNSYGGPDGLKKLVNACHRKGMAVILDVVYNHLGPEGNYAGEFGFYFTERYRTPWGDAVNFDGPHSEHVRSFFIGNALYWINEFHVDALRLDAVHGMFDFSARHFLQELAEEVHRHREALGRKIYVIAEDELNDVRMTRPPQMGGYGLDAQWCDDFHHALHTLITGENKGYYEAFGRFDQMGKAFSEGFVYPGGYPSRGKGSRGSVAGEISPSRLVVFSQNHDQVGNRMTGERLSASQPFEKLTLAAAVVVLSPYLPLLFMGEEYGEKAPFLYFTSHSDPSLVEAVRKGRREEFSAFAWEGEVPDPQDVATFLRSKIDLALHGRGEHAVLFRFYRRLIELRKKIPALQNFDRRNIEVTGFEREKVLLVKRRAEKSETLCIYNFSAVEQEIDIAFGDGILKRVLDSSAREWGGRGKVAERLIHLTGGTVRVGPFGFVLYRNSG